MSKNESKIEDFIHLHKITLAFLFMILLLGIVLVMFFWAVKEVDYIKSNPCDVCEEQGNHCYKYTPLEFKELEEKLEQDKMNFSSKLYEDFNIK